MQRWFAKARRAGLDDESIDEITSADLAGAYPVIQYGPPDADLVIDLLARFPLARQLFRLPPPSSKRLE